MLINMDQKNLPTIIVAVLIAAAIGFIAGNLAFKSAYIRTQHSEVVSVISPDFPSSQLSNYFNNNSLDPTQLINIGNNNNNTLFSNSQP
jgi:hypothetical protein